MERITVDKMDSNLHPSINLESETGIITVFITQQPRASVK